MVSRRVVFFRRDGGRSGKPNCVDFPPTRYIIKEAILKELSQKVLSESEFSRVFLAHPSPLTPHRFPRMSSVAGPRIIDVAEQIVADIRKRRLRTGDPYPGTAETAQRLRISGSTVNRAFQLLAQRGVVQRRQRKGTIVGEVEPRRNEATLRRVHLVVREDHLRAEGLWADGVLWGLQGALPGVELQFNFRPEVDEAEYVEQMIGDVLRSRQPAGLVLIRSTVVTQRLVAASGLPAVVSGTLQPSITNLPSVDRDQRQIGVLLAKHLLEVKCKRFAIFTRERIAPGDHLTIDGALATLAAAGVPLKNVQLRSLPSDAAAIHAAAQELLSAHKSQLGCFCRSGTLARGIAAAATGLKLPPKRRPQIVIADAAGSADLPYPKIETTITAEAFGKHLGEMLAAAAKGERPEPYHVVVPVRLSTRRSDP